MLLRLVVVVCHVQRFQSTAHRRLHRVVPLIVKQSESVRFWDVTRRQARDVRFTLRYNSKQQPNTTFVLKSERIRYHTETVHSRDLVHAIHRLTSVNARDHSSRRVQCQSGVKRGTDGVRIEEGVAQEVDGANRQPHENRLCFETGRDGGGRTNHYT